FLSMMRIPLVALRRRTKRFSLSTQKRRCCRLGRKRRLVLIWEWETLFPTAGPFPVTWQTLDIDLSPDFNCIEQTQIRYQPWAFAILRMTIYGPGSNELRFIPKRPEGSKRKLIFSPTSPTTESGIPRLSPGVQRGYIQPRSANDSQYPSPTIR